jgi:hypothetical protein
VRWGVLILVAAFAARANDNDVQLFRLGHPDALGCTRCDGSPGDSAEPADPLAQTRFHRYASTLGLAFAPPFQETAGTLGEAGFEVGLSSQESFVKFDSASWAAPSAPPSVLVLPTLSLRKGLGGSFELGAAITWLSKSQAMALSADIRWALIDGIHYAPDFAIRLWGSRLLGDGDLDLFSLCADAQLSKSWGLGGTLAFQPYVQGGIQMINALSGVIDFKPSVENDANPTADDDVFHTVDFWENRYFRGAVGFRLVAGAVVLAFEGNYAHGNNPVQHDKIGGVAPPRETVELWSVAGRLAFRF